MIERHWKGIARVAEADAYTDHLLTETFPKLKTISGFTGASILKRPVDDGVEFLVITRWNSMDAIVQFAGERADTAVVPDKVKKMMVSFDASVAHYDVVANAK